jgi:hypothetical protein
MAILQKGPKNADSPRPEKLNYVSRLKTHPETTLISGDFKATVVRNDTPVGAGLLSRRDNPTIARRLSAGKGRRKVRPSRRLNEPQASLRDAGSSGYPARRFSACHYPHLFIRNFSSTSTCTEPPSRGDPKQRRCGPVWDANGVAHTSPGQRPGNRRPKTILSAESATHAARGRGVWRRRVFGVIGPYPAYEAGRWPANTPKGTETQGVALGWYESGRWPGGLGTIRSSQ